jgi:hypothetical protein
MSDSEESYSIQLKAKRLIICEGKGDQSFFRELIKRRVLLDFDVFCPPAPGTKNGGVGGFAKLLEGLSVQRGFDSLTGILVVADNDDDPEESFKKVFRIIKNASGFQAPSRPLQVVRADGVPPLAVLMLPWVNEPGALESLCLVATSYKFPQVRKCLERYVRCTGAKNWKPGKLLKMKMRCMLSATCETDPNTSLVWAWAEDRGDPIPLDNRCFEQLVGFLKDFDGFMDQS